MTGPRTNPKPIPRADQAHPTRALLGLGHVGDVGLRHGEAAGADPRPEPRDEEHRQRVGVGEEDEADDRPDDAPEQDGAAPGAIAHLPPEGHEAELHERVGRAEQGGHEIARPVRPRHAGEVGHDEAEAEEIEEDGEDDRPERRPTNHGETAAFRRA